MAAVLEWSMLSGESTKEMHPTFSATLKNDDDTDKLWLCFAGFLKSSYNVENYHKSLKR